MGKKRLKNRATIGANMQAAAAQQSGSPSDELNPGSRTLEKQAVFEELARSLGGTVRRLSPVEEEKPADESNSQVSELLRLLADIATGLWRLRSKMGNAPAAADNRVLHKQLEAIFDILNTAEVQVRDHTGELVPAGGIYNLKVLAYEPALGLSKEQVIETLKPTVYFKGQPIQTGEVIVGTPKLNGMADHDEGEQ
ncbi:MAG: hypothetical protein DMF69_14050 [Acidobacteria bacterium]|nr:MAG: hypothetical protein DMF69_14050 [Acidobacteriota bacterium]